jgi:phosphatidate phosphatase LPIN
MPMVGKEWNHPGVAALYTSIKNHGYEILYLTSRAIGQAKQTKDFLIKLAQGKTVLPKGPVIMSPDRLIPAFTREVIHRRPEIFKIAVLKDIKSIFPKDHSPFYAGFGNRDTDAISYRTVEVPMGKIFIINPQSQIHQFFNTALTNSYFQLNEMVHEVFPAMNELEEYRVSEEFNQVNFWNPNYHISDDKMPLDIKELIK